MRYYLTAGRVEGFPAKHELKQHMTHFTMKPFLDKPFRAFKCVHVSNCNLNCHSVFSGSLWLLRDKISYPCETRLGWRVPVILFRTSSKQLQRTTYFKDSNHTESSAFMLSGLKTVVARHHCSNARSSDTGMSLCSIPPPLYKAGQNKLLSAL